MSSTPGNSTLTLVVAADKTGLEQLQAAFAALNASVKGTLSSLNAATAEMSSGGVAELAQMRNAVEKTTGAIGVLQAQNDILTAKVEEGAARRGAAATKTADTEVRAAAKAAAAAEAASVKEASAAERAAAVQEAAAAKSAAAWVAATEASAGLAISQRDLASAFRGAESAAGLGLPVYGSLIPLMLAYVTVATAISEIKLGAEFQKQLAFVGIVSGETGDKLAAAGEQFKKFAEASQFSTDHVTKGAEELSRAGLSLADSLTVLPQLLKFSALGQLDVAESAKFAGATMHAFGLTVADIPHILDSTAKAALSSMTTIGQMSEGLRTASLAGSQFGVSLDEMNALLAVLARRGIDGNSAGMALMTMFRALDPMTAKGRDTLKELNIQLTDGAGNYRKIVPLLQSYATEFAKYDQQSQAGLAKGIFSSRAARGAVVELAEATKALPELFDKIANSQGTVEAKAENINALLSVQGAEALHAFENAAIGAFEALAPQLTDMASGLKDFATDPAIKDGLTAMLQIFIAIGTAAGVFASAAVKVASVVGAAGRVKTPGGATLSESVGTMFGDAADIVTGKAPFSLSTKQNNLDSLQALAAQRRAREIREGLEAVAAYDRTQNQGEIGSLRGMEAATTNNVTGTGAWSKVPPTAGLLHRDPDAKKAAEREAQAEITALLAKYHEEERDEKSAYANSLAELRAYHADGLITDKAFNDGETALISKRHSDELENEDTLITQLGVLRAKAGNDAKRNTALDTEIEKVREERVRTVAGMERDAVIDAGKSWEKYNATGAQVLDTSVKSTAQMQVEVNELKNLSVIKKDSVALADQVRIALDKETLARLQSSAALVADGAVLTDKQKADLLEIAAIQARLPLLQADLDLRKALTAEKTNLENDWTVGAIKGLNLYLETGLSTAKVMENAFKKGFTAIEDALVNLVMHGKLDFKALADSIIADIARMVIKMEISQPLARMAAGMLSGMGGSGGVVQGLFSLLGVTGSTTGGGSSGSASGVFGIGTHDGAAGGGASNLGSLVSTGSTVANQLGGGSLIAGAGTGIGGAFGTGVLTGAGDFVGTGLAGLAGNAALAAGATDAFAEAVASAVPVIGWIVAIAAVLYAVFGATPGGPKGGGSALEGFNSAGQLTNSNLAVPGTDNGRFFTPNQADPSMRSLANTTSASYYAAYDSLGGLKPSATSFGFGYDTDPNGKSGNRVSSGTYVDGVLVAGSKDRPVGNDNAGLGTELTTEAQRALLAALQASDLPEDIAKILKTISSVTGSSGDVTNVLQLANAYATLSKAMATFDPADIIKKAQRSSTEVTHDEGTALLDMAGKTHLTTESITALANATNTFRTAAANLVLEFENAKHSIDNMFANTVRSIQMAGLDDNGKYKYLQSEADSLFGKAQNSSSITEIQALATQINSDINTSFGMLTPQQQHDMQNEYLSRITLVNTTLQTRISALEKTATDENATTLKTIEGLMQDLVEKSTSAADKQVDAANKQVDAANTVNRLTITIVDGTVTGVVNA